MSDAPIPSPYTVTQIVYTQPLEVTDAIVPRGYGMTDGREFGIKMDGLIIVAKNAPAWHSIREHLVRCIDLGDKVFPQLDSFDLVRIEEARRLARYGREPRPRRRTTGGPGLGLG